MRGASRLPGQHPRKARLSAPALALGAATLVLGAGVAAQEAVMGLRQRATGASTQSFLRPTDAEDPAALGIGASPSMRAQRQNALRMLIGMSPDHHCC